MMGYEAPDGTFWSCEGKDYKIYFEDEYSEKTFKNIIREIKEHKSFSDELCEDLLERTCVLPEEALKQKRLWKARSTCVYTRLPIPCKTDYTDVRELTVDEAVSWYKDWAKHLNDYHSDAFTVYSNGLFYKKDGEWLRYEVKQYDDVIYRFCGYFILVMVCSQ